MTSWRYSPMQTGIWGVADQNKRRDMARKITLPPVDQAKLLICEMDERDIESVLAYGKYWLSQLKKRAKLLAKGEPIK